MGRLCSIAGLFILGCDLTGAGIHGENPPITWWNMTEAIQNESLVYDDWVTAFAAQGLINRVSPRLMFFDIGANNYDWPHADRFWIERFKEDGFSLNAIESSLCTLVNVAQRENSTSGLVVYEGSGKWLKRFGDGYSAALALTLAGQHSLLPVSTASLQKHECLKEIAIKIDLRAILSNKTRDQAWEWAINTLLPNASKATVFNLNHYRKRRDPLPFKFDKQSEATTSSIDYIIQQNAFVLDLESHTSSGTSTAPWSNDDEFIQRIFAQLDPLFDAYGWSDDEFSWTNETSHFGGTVFCSFASPNLSFWARLTLSDGRTKARRLPASDRGLKLNRSKYYVTFETNEGDTPRILVSAMASAWSDTARGSIPVSWAIDPLLAQKFPALFDYFAKTATHNDSFIAGTAGAGYAYLNQMTTTQVQTYGKRVGHLAAQYGPNVFDTYGYANLSVHEVYAQAAASVPGGAPAAFVSQPNWLTKQAAPYDPYNCTKGNQLLSDGTPLICTSGTPRLFYFSSTLDVLCPSCDLASRIKSAAMRQPPPYFVTVYGGLQAFGGVETKSKKSFFTLLHDTLRRLGDSFVPIGASEMARLAKEALLVS